MARAVNIGEIVLLMFSSGFVFKMIDNPTIFAGFYLAGLVYRNNIQSARFIEGNHLFTGFLGNKSNNYTD